MRRLPALVLTGALALSLVGCAPEPATSGGVTPSGGPSGPGASPSAPSAPRVSALSSDAGGLTGGDRVTLTGEGLASVTGVSFGEVAATGLEHAADGTLSVVVPPSNNFVSGEVALALATAEGPVAFAGEAPRYHYSVISGVDRQMDYLFRHWNNYNTAEWGNMNPSGGDCTNFTSQGLIARGWQQSSLWSSPGVNAPASTESWRFTPSMDAWLASDTSRGAVRLEMDQRDQLKIGDIGIFLWTGTGRPDHVMTVSRVEVVDGVTKVAFVSHNLDGDYRDLDEVIAEKNALNAAAGGGQMKAWFYSIPE